VKVWSRVARLASRFASNAVILLYHRVADVQPDPWSLAVSPRHFDEHLEVIRRRYHPLPLEGLVVQLEQGKVQRGSVAITFDDGYADNLLEAKPLLERHDCPATVFLTSGAIDADREFWWDELERILLAPGVLPPVLEVTSNGTTRLWNLEGGQVYSEQAAREHTSWRAGHSAPTPRHALYESLWKLLHASPPEERERLLSVVRAWAGSGSHCRPSHRTLSSGQASALVQGGLVRAGAHTISHAALSSLPLERQRTEIAGSKARIEEVVEHSVASFSYPFGRPEDYTAESVALVREAGFTSACSNARGVVHRSADRYQLPRVYVSDWDGETFGAALAGALTAARR
jgi:peptidoglycan/xylan/chitin deacetylase (PgdA/CDA1 family)